MRPGKSKDPVNRGTVNRGFTVLLSIRFDHMRLWPHVAKMGVVDWVWPIVIEGASSI